MATKKKTDGKRSQKVAEQLRGELMNMLLAGEVHDPGVKTATVSAVVLTDDLRLAKGSRAIDKGIALPNINDGFKGKAPDVGAYELGDEFPQYGPRAQITVP